jgi:hypothetical protein
MEISSFSVGLFKHQNYFIDFDLYQNSVTAIYLREDQIEFIDGRL